MRGAVLLFLVFEVVRIRRRVNEITKFGDDHAQTCRLVQKACRVRVSPLSVNSTMHKCSAKVGE